MPFWAGAIPVSFDFFATSLSMIGLSLVAASVYQMMRGMVVVIAAFYSILFLGRKYHRHHWTGLFLITSGIALVGYGGMRASSSSGDSQTSFLGIAMIILAQFFTAAIGITEEKLFTKYRASPMKMIGLEGAWGTPIFAVILVILNFIPCKSE